MTESELRGTVDWVGRKGPFEVTFDLTPKRGEGVQQVSYEGYEGSGMLGISTEGFRSSQTTSWKKVGDLIRRHLCIEITLKNKPTYLFEVCLERGAGDL